VAAIRQLVQVHVLGQQLPVAVSALVRRRARSSAATTTVTGADSFTAGGVSRASAK